MEANINPEGILSLLVVFLSGSKMKTGGNSGFFSDKLGCIELIDPCQLVRMTYKNTHST
jgi:hypothetical protein